MSIDTKPASRALAAGITAMTAIAGHHPATIAPPPTFVARPCPPAAAGATVELTCGTVAVPENRDNAASRQIDIAVLIAHTPATPKAPDPVMLLTGGPSPSINNTIAAFAQAGSAAQLGNRDLITLDYRGFGLSTPNLGCATDSQGRYDVARCIAALRHSGADLAGYTTDNIVADVDAVRHALHLAPLNVWGTSYGSRVALALDRDFPDDVRSMILDGPDPLQTRLTARWLLERAAAVPVLIGGCERDAACGAAFPDLRARYEGAVTRLNAHPLTVDGAPLTGDALALTLWAAQTNIGDLPKIPQLMDEAARGSLTTLSSLSGSTARANGAGTAADMQISCGDDIVPADRPAVARLLGTTPLVSALVREIDFRTRTLCEPWPYVRLSQEQREPLASDVPTLIFSGQYDPTLPLPEAIRAAHTLSDSRIIDFPGYAHVALGNGPCPVAIAQQFFGTLDPIHVDASCTRSLPQPAWLTADAMASTSASR